MAKKEIPGDCVGANTSVFYFYLSKGRYPNEAKIPPNVCPDKMIGGIDHQLVEFQKNIKRAYSWKLIQGTILNRMDSLPMAHCWCETTLEDIRGLWKRHSTLDGRFVFDFTQTKGHLGLTLFDPLSIGSFYSFTINIVVSNFETPPKICPKI